MTEARLIALDWGTSNLRASLLGDGGRVVDSRASASGVMAVADGRFGDALLALAGDWIDAHRCPLVASGMVGSRQGWREAPYLPCPARLADAARQLLPIDVRPGVVLHVVPGLVCTGRDGEHDVMRGEETQLWGAGIDGCCVLPGTHSKWAWTGAGGVAVQRFQTHMTGELYALLTQHGILGRLMVHGAASAPGFERGVRLGLAEHANLTHAIFAARSAGLMQTVPAAALPDFLSGLLIGAEIAGALLGERPDRVTLIGDAALVERYATALALAGIAAERCDAGATTRGLWRVASAAGLVA